MKTSNNGNKTSYKYSRGKPRINSKQRIVNKLYSQKR